MVYGCYNGPSLQADPQLYSIGTPASHSITPVNPSTQPMVKHSWPAISARHIGPRAWFNLASYEMPSELSHGGDGEEIAVEATHSFVDLMA